MAEIRIACLTVLAAALCGTHSAGAQTLSDAYRAALEHDPDFLGSKDDAAAAREGDAQARALFRPKVSGQVEADYNRTSIEAELPPPLDGIVPLDFSGGVYTAGIQVQQPIVNGEARAQARQLRARARASDATLEGSRQQLALRVVQAYFAVLAARDEIASLQAQEASARREQAAAQARFDAGRARITDVREAQARADAAAAQAVTAAAQHTLALARFTELTGLDDNAVVPFRSDIQPRAPAESLAAWEQRGEGQSPLVIAREHAAEAARAKADRFTWGAQVKLDAVGSASRMGRAGGQNRLPFPDAINTASIGLRLQVPLYTGGGLASQQREAAAQARSAEEALRSAQRDVRLDIEEAWTAQSSSVAAIEALRTTLVSARLQEKAAITGRELGIRTQSDVLAAQAQVFEIERRLNDAFRDYESSRFSLSAAAGVLDDVAFSDIDRDISSRGSAVGSNRIGPQKD